MKDKIKSLINKFMPSAVFVLAGRFSIVRSSDYFSKKPLQALLKYFKWVFYDFFNLDINFTTPDGTKFFSMSKNYSSFIVCFDDYRDKTIQKFIEKKLAPGDVFVDAGANIGTYTIRAGKVLGKDGKVIAIEAHPKTYSYLLKNIELNDLKNVVPVNVALGSENGEIEMSYNESNAGETHVSKGEENKINVKLEKLDSVLDKLGVDRVDYIKVDVEGFEHSLILGSKNTILQNRDIIVQTELIDEHSRKYGHPITDLIDLMYSFGLSPHEVYADGSFKKLSIEEILKPCDVLWWRD